MPARIAYYISGHGYGHAARQHPIIRRLIAQGAQIFVRSSAPAKFFRMPNVSHHARAYDVGMRQADALTMDVPGSLAAYAALLREQDAIIAAEVDFLRGCGVQLVVGDMPPLAFEISAAAGLPSVAITHFTWDWVYAHYIDRYPEYAPLIPAIRAIYGKATAALELPYAHEFDMFPRVEKMPFVVNDVTRSRADLCAEFGVDPAQRIALLSMGGLGWGSGDVRAIGALRGWVFMVMPGAWEQVRHLPNVRLIPMDYPDYHNWIAAADVLIGKAGGSTVSEVIAHRTPMIYTLRDDWRENALLDAALRECCKSLCLPLADFEAGRWVEALEAFHTQPYTWPSVAVDGAERIAARLLALADDA